MWQVSLIWYGRLSWEEVPKWRDIAYLSLTQGQWMGVDLFFTPVYGSKMDHLFRTFEKQWVQFSRFYTRQRPVEEGDAVMKLYIREEFFSINEDLSYFTVLDLMESFGAFWTFMVLTVGAIAREAVNRKKNDLQLEHVFKEHGHTDAGKFFGKKGEDGVFNWETERDFVDLLMRDRKDALGEMSNERGVQMERLKAEIGQERDKALKEMKAAAVISRMQAKKESDS